MNQPKTILGRYRGNKLRCVFAALRLARLKEGWFGECATRTQYTHSERSLAIEMTYAITGKGRKQFYCRNVFGFLPSHMSAHTHIKTSTNPFRCNHQIDKRKNARSIKPPADVCRPNKAWKPLFNLIWRKILLLSFLLRFDILSNKLWIVVTK